MTNPNTRSQFEPPIGDRVEEMIILSDLYGQFMRVERATYRDGRPETDGEHTLHAMFLAVAYTAKYHPEFNPAEVALLIMIHDLDEVFVGDVNSFMADHNAIRQKEEDEEGARKRLRELLGDHPFILDLLERYWRQEEPITRYVRTIEKMDPSLSHLANRGEALRQMGVEDRQQFDNNHQRAMGRFVLIAGDLAPDLVALRQQLGQRVADVAFGTV